MPSEWRMIILHVHSVWIWQNSIWSPVFWKLNKLQYVFNTVEATCGYHKYLQYNYRKVESYFKNNQTIHINVNSNVQKLSVRSI